MNNPFASSAQTRFPDITTSSPDPNGNQFTAWVQPSANQLDQSGFLQQQQLSPQYTQFSPMSDISQHMASPIQSPPFQPSSFFGQQLAAGLGSSYGYLQNQPTSTPQAYNPAQQQLQSSTYIPQFDPYSKLGSLENSTQAAQTGGSLASHTATAAAPLNGHLHPREYVRTHKQELDTWDTYSWKQLISAFDALKETWTARKQQLEAQVTQLQMQLQYGGGAYYAPQIQQEGARLQALAKEAESNSDSVAASLFQISEVFSSYRQSGDLASKRRVREAANAALQGIPDWPQQ